MSTSCPRIFRARGRVPRNYFELYSLKPHFDVDLHALAARKRALQLQFHPDRLASISSSALPAALESSGVDLATVSSEVNIGYSTLVDPVLRGLHLLQLHFSTLQDGKEVDLSPEENPDASAAAHVDAFEAHRLSGEFLEEMMDLHEEIEGIREAREEGLSVADQEERLRELQSTFEQYWKSAEEQVRCGFQALWSEPSAAETSDAIHDVIDGLSKLRYFRRLLNSVRDAVGAEATAGFIGSPAFEAMAAAGSESRTIL